MKPKYFSILKLLVPVLAILATWSSGFWGYSAYGALDYGVPLPWKTSQIIPTCASCPLPISYNWVFFLLDAIFYSAIGYAIILLYMQLVQKPQSHLTDPSEKVPQ